MQHLFFYSETIQGKIILDKEHMFVYNKSQDIFR